MQRTLSISFIGLFLSGCGAADGIRQPTEPGPIAIDALSLSSRGAPTDIDATAAVTDAIERLVPALGPVGAALGAPLRQLRDGKRLDRGLIDVVTQQLAALVKDLPPESVADADALGVTLDVLRAVAGK